MITEPRVIVGAEPCAVWLSAYRLLLAHGNRFNLTLHIQQPLAFDDDELVRFDPSGVNRGVRPLRDVATTIFPARSSRWDLSVDDFCDHYTPMYRRLLGRGPRSWGCYFLRLIAFENARNNQLERTINGLSTWGHGHRAAFVVHFSAFSLDKPRPLGAPCLQYVQFMVNDDGRLCLTAVYRSHDYFHKALGNLVGLSRLLDYVASKSGHQVGTLSCLSTYAFVDVPRRLSNALIAHI